MDGLSLEAPPLEGVEYPGKGAISHSGNLASWHSDILASGILPSPGHQHQGHQIPWELQPPWELEQGKHWYLHTGGRQGEGGSHKLDGLCIVEKLSLKFLKSLSLN